MVTVTGTGFTAGSTVSFGSTPATLTTVTGGTTLSATTPAGSGTVDITVTTAGGTSTTSSSDLFTYRPVPVVTAIAPTAGPLAGGTAVTVTGSGFTPGTTVDFGTIPSTSVADASTTSLTAISPAGPAGAVDVTVTTAGGTSATTPSDLFSDDPVPVVTTVAPAAGPLAGGTVVTVTATGLVAGATVHFGASPATRVTVSGATLTATSPAGTGGENITVTTPGGTSTAVSADVFSYEPVPRVTSLTPSAGPLTGATAVTVTGTGFTAGSTVDFGTTPGSLVTLSGTTSLTATSPAGAGAVNVTVVTPGGTSATVPADLFTYDPVPTVTSVAPSAGPLTGGTAVTVTGTGFVTGATVQVGTTPATAVHVVGPTTITVTSPVGLPGQADVTVTTPGGTSATGAPDTFSYDPVPTVTSAAPDAGPLAGGTPVAVTGTGFTAGSVVSFGAVHASSVVVAGPTALTAVSPAGTAGVVNVTVTTPGGTSATATADLFTYNSAPAVTSIAPAGGPLDGGTAVTVRGAGFTSGATVDFGSMAASSTTVTSPTTLTVTSPAGSSGGVNVTVTGPGGTSATSPSDLFSYDPVPTVTSATPAAGPLTGGTVVTVTGTGFVAAPTVLFGSRSATTVVVVNTTTLRATAPAGTGSVDTTVTTPGGTSTSGPSDTFRYDPAPTVTGITPDEGPVAGGTTVTVTGSGFIAGSTVVDVGTAPDAASALSAAATCSPRSGGLRLRGAVVPGHVQVSVSGSRVARMRR